jgi:hypothetical protein
VLPVGFDLFSLPWIWMVDAHQPGTLNEASVPADVTTWSDQVDVVPTEPAPGEYLLTLTGGLTTHRIGDFVTNFDGLRQMSISLEFRLGATQQWWRVANHSTGTPNMYVDMLNGAIGNVTGGTAKYEAIDSGWGRATLTVPTAKAVLRMTPTSMNGGGYTFDGDGLSSTIRNVRVQQAFVQEWPDLVGSHPPLQGVPANQPLWLPDEFNGRPTVQGDGLASFMATAAWAVAQPYELWVVANWIGPGGVVERLFHSLGASVYLQRAGAGTAAQIYAGSGVRTAGFAGTANDEQSIGAYYDGAASELIMGGVPYGGVNLGTNGLAGFTLFANKTGTAYYVPGNLSWAAIAGRKLTADERLLLRADLDERWGPLL